MKKIIIRIIGAFIIVIGLNMWSLKQSPLDKFPVPRTAKAEKTHSDSITYKWNGINRLYRFQVQLSGWRKVDQIGSLIFYSKGGKEVGLLTDNENFSILKR